MLTVITTLVSRNALAVAAIVALFGWHIHHDRNVRAEGAQRAVAAIEKKTDALVTKAKVAQRRIDPAQSGGVLQRKYCGDC